MIEDISALDGLEAENTDEAVEMIGSLLERDERIEDFQKKLVSSIQKIPYDSISYVLDTEAGEYQLSVLYDTSKNEVERHSIRKN